MITEQAYQEAAQKLKTDTAAIKAVAEVESRGNGFLSTGEPVILFERHIFHRLTGGKYSKTHPNISNPVSGGYGAVSIQHQRLQEATALDRNAALQSASWGKFQIMGFNHQLAGFTKLQDFINAMYKSEDEHLKAFVNFIINSNLGQHLRAKNWAAFAKAYNGSAYAKNQYDKKLEQAYRRYTNA